MTTPASSSSLPQVRGAVLSLDPSDKKKQKKGGARGRKGGRKRGSKGGRVATGSGDDRDAANPVGLKGGDSSQGARSSTQQRSADLPGHTAGVKVSPEGSVQKSVPRSPSSPETSLARARGGFVPLREGRRRGRLRPSARVPFDDYFEGWRVAGTTRTKDELEALDVLEVAAMRERQREQRRGRHLSVQRGGGLSAAGSDAAASRVDERSPTSVGGGIPSYRPRRRPAAASEGGDGGEAGRGDGDGDGVGVGVGVGVGGDGRRVGAESSRTLTGGGGAIYGLFVAPTPRSREEHFRDELARKKRMYGLPAPSSPRGGAPSPSAMAFSGCARSLSPTSSRVERALRVTAEHDPRRRGSAAAHHRPAGPGDAPFSSSSLASDAASPRIVAHGAHFAKKTLVATLSPRAQLWRFDIPERPGAGNDVAVGTGTPRRRRKPNEPGTPRTPRRAPPPPSRGDAAAPHADSPLPEKSQSPSSPSDAAGSAPRTDATGAARSFPATTSLSSSSSSESLSSKPVAPASSRGDPSLLERRGARGVKVRAGAGASHADVVEQEIAALSAIATTHGRASSGGSTTHFMRISTPPDGSTRARLSPWSRGTSRPADSPVDDEEVDRLLQWSRDLSFQNFVASNGSSSNAQLDF